LDTATESKTVAGDRKLDAQATKGLLLQYTLYLQKEGYDSESRYKGCIRMLINSGADLNNPEHVKTIIAQKSWANGTKMQVTYAYDALTKMLKLSWTPPRYRQEEAFPFIPDQKELEALILGSNSKRMTAYLQTLKETMADPSEALRLRWIDLNDNIITINRPVKGHYPRRIQVSGNLVSMLNALDKTSENVFPTTYMNLEECYVKLRKKTAMKLNNPRVLKITFRTFRHWGATMLYHQTRDILLVKKLLGHKKIENTMKYTQLVNFKDDDYEETTATTEEEIRALGKAGFTKYDEQNGIHFYRKPKRFVSLA
jgi:integrase